MGSYEGLEEGRQCLRHWGYRSVDVVICQLSTGCQLLSVGLCEGIHAQSVQNYDLLSLYCTRRSEDICWVKTNRQHASKHPHLDSTAVLQHTKEHCLVGIKGSVKRNIDTQLIHANMDVDLLVDEERPQGQTDKPEEVSASPPT